MIFLRRINSHEDVVWKEDTLTGLFKPHLYRNLKEQFPVWRPFFQLRSSKMRKRPVYAVRYDDPGRVQLVWDQKPMEDIMKVYTTPKFGCSRYRKPSPRRIRKVLARVIDPSKLPKVTMYPTQLHFRAEFQEIERENERQMVADNFAEML